MIDGGVKLVNLAAIKQACETISGVANSTPVMTSRTADGKLGASVFFKCENFQRTGSFKFRGAYNAVSRLSGDERKRGVVTHSSGNHAQALALAAKIMNVPCTVVMPSNSSAIKIDATRGYGAEVVMCGPSLSDRKETAEKLVSKHGYVLVHPYDNDDIIAGAGTSAYELLQAVENLDYIFCPVGGGGLISGTSVAAKALLPATKVIGCEPQKADDAYRSFRSGELVPNLCIDTIADGLRTSLCPRTFGIILENVDDIVLVSEEVIVDAMRFFWERMKLVVEPSGAVSLAGLLSKKIDVGNRRVGVIVSGGNVDLTSFFMELK